MIPVASVYPDAIALAANFHLSSHGVLTWVQAWLVDLYDAHIENAG